MSVLGTISLSGLTTTTSDFIQTANLEVTSNLTVDNGATITLPNNSISDSALSTNVMLLNATQTSTNPKTFQTTTQNSIPLAIKSTAISPNPTISFSPYTSATGYNPIVQAGDAIMFTDNATGICLGPHTSSYSGFRADNNNTQQYGKSSLSYYVWDSTVALKKVWEALATTLTAYLPLYAPTPASNTNDTRVITSAYGNTYFPQLTTANTLTGLNTFTQSITGVTEPTIENSTKMASTAYVKNQGYITTASLTGYAQLASNQTFSGLNTFSQSVTGVTEPVAENSTKLASTAWVKLQNYLTSASLTNYAQLSGVPQTFSNSNTFTQSIVGVTEATAENSTKMASTAYVQNQGYITTASLTGYAQLAANQTFTGTNTFNNWISVPAGIRLTNFSPSSTPFSNSQYLGYHLYQPSSTWGITPGATWASMYDFVFDNSTNLRYGLYLLEYTFRWTSTSGTGTASVNFSTTMAATNSLYMTTQSSGSLNGATYYYVQSLSMTQYINSATTWYCNCAVSISGTVTFDTNSNVRLTRLA